MRARSPWGARPILRLYIRDARYFAAVFAAVLGAGFLLTSFANQVAAPALEFPLVALAAAGAIFAAIFWRVAWHDFANHFFIAPSARLMAPWVIDGDTIDDKANGVRYRFANIDAPETDSTCYKEAARGQLAKAALIALVRGAKDVSVRKTFRTDRFGRRVAFVLIDGEDAGRLLMARGLAVPWRGWRRTWCGPRGGLARLARAGAMAHACKKCRAFG